MFLNAEKIVDIKAQIAANSGSTCVLFYKLSRNATSGNFSKLSIKHSHR